MKKRGMDLSDFEWNIMRIEWAIESKNDLDSLDKNGDSALLYECRMGNLKIVKMLLEHGANPQTSNMEGNTPLHISSRRGYASIVQLLLEYGADESIQNEHGETALMYAAYSGDLRSVKALIEAGANPDVRSNRKETAIVTAFYFNKRDIANFLLGLNPDINPLMGHRHIARFFDVYPQLRNYIEKNIDALTPQNQKAWKAYRLKALFSNKR